MLVVAHAQWPWVVGGSSNGHVAVAVAVNVDDNDHVKVNDDDNVDGIVLV